MGYDCRQGAAYALARYGFFLQMSTAAAVTLKKDLARSLRQGHPWIYRDALRAPPDLESGRLVLVRGRDRRPLAWGFWDVTSPIAVRVLDRQPVVDPDALIGARLAGALALRRARLDPSETSAFRWVHGEGDHLPGIHVDLYDDVATVRYDGEGARAFYRRLPGLLAQAWGSPLRAVVDRQHRSEQLEVVVRENGLRFQVDLAHGQKGGLFLDQRENRAEVGRRASGKTVLNLFGYTAGFSIYAAAAGASSTDTVDAAAPALAAARRNFALNGLPLDRAGLHAGDAFAFLAEAARGRRRWDIVISDPPSFAPSARALTAARAAYRRLHALAAAVVEPGGLLCAASCSSHFGRDEFLASVAEGTARAGRRWQLECVRGAGFDHPVLPIFPEGDYLKFAIGRVD
jgi:23S rRNA (cytosine1962-C5)-methyltransferase